MVNTPPGTQTCAMPAASFRSVPASRSGDATGVPGGSVPAADPGGAVAAPVEPGPVGPATLGCELAAGPPEQAAAMAAPDSKATSETDRDIGSGLRLVARPRAADGFEAAPV